MCGKLLGRHLPQNTRILGQFGAETSLILVNANTSENQARMDRNALEKNATEEVFRGMA